MSLPLVPTATLSLSELGGRWPPEPEAQTAQRATNYVTAWGMYWMDHARCCMPCDGTEAKRTGDRRPPASLPDASAAANVPVPLHAIMLAELGQCRRHAEGRPSADGHLRNTAGRRPVTKCHQWARMKRGPTSVRRFHAHVCVRVSVCSGWRSSQRSFRTRRQWTAAGIG